MNAPGIKDAYVNGQKYRTTNRNGVVVYDGMTPYRENYLMLDVSQSDSEAELRGNWKIAAPYRGAVVLVNFDTDQRKPWFIKALRADGQPLTFGYEVNDIHGHNIGVVGREASYLFAPMKYRHRLMWQLISNKGFHAQSPSVKRLMKVEIIFASNSQVVLWKFA